MYRLERESTLCNHENEIIINSTLSKAGYLQASHEQFYITVRGNEEEGLYLG